ncbi:hypothetical protein Tco_0494655 [Tanacetum coccineum]
MGGAILTLVSRVKKLERTVKQLRSARLVGDAPATEGDVDIQDAVDLEGLSRMASEALGHDQATVPSEDMEEREEEEVPLRRKRSVYRRARTEFYTPAFAQFHAPRSTDVLPQADISESAGPSVGADKGKAPMPDLEIPAEFLAEDAQARQRLEEEQASARLVQQLQAEDLAQADVPLVSEQRAKELDELLLRMTGAAGLTLMMPSCTNLQIWHGRKKRALADLRYRALKGKPLKHSEVTQMMRTLVKNQWCAAHNGTITMKAVKAMSKQQLIEEYENICRCLEKDRLLSAQYNLFRPKPAIGMLLVDMVINPPWNLPFLGAKGLTSPEQTATDWKLLLRDVAASFDSAVHRVHAVSFDAAVASIVSAACCVAAGYFVCCCCLLCSCCSSILLPQEDLSRNLELTESTPIVPADSSSSIPADYVSAGHVLVPADRDRIC